MTGKTVTRAELSEAVYQKIGLTRTESGGLVEQVLGEICDTLVRGENVKLSGFGRFMVRSKGESASAAIPGHASRCRLRSAGSCSLSLRSISRLI